MNKFFNRMIEVTVSDRLTGKSVSVSELNIDFSVDKSIEGNTAKITIYNCSPETINRIVGGVGKKAVFLSAGHEDTGLQCIFKGDVIHSEDDQQNPDTNILFECSTGIEAEKESTISISYKEGSSAKEILSKIIDSFKKVDSPKLQLSGVQDVKLNAGFSHNGKTSDAMNKLAGILGIQWTNQDNKVKVYKRGGSDGSRIFVLDADSGLIGTPKALKADSSGGVGTGLSYEINSLLLPSLEIGSAVSVRTKNLTLKDMVVSKIGHKGSYFGASFNSLIRIDPAK